MSLLEIVIAAVLIGGLLAFIVAQAVRFESPFGQEEL